MALLEKEDRWAAHQSGRNSGVIHAGVYYKPGSLRARLGVAGNESMVRFCQENDVPHDRCGKIIVATHMEDLPRMRSLRERARTNGLAVRELSPGEAREIEPHVRCVGAIHVPVTGIVDFGAVARVYARQIEARGGELHLQHAVQEIQVRGRDVRILTREQEFQGRFLVNCAGLYCDQIARLDGVEPGLQIVPFRGEYYKIREERRHLVRHLIYPMPNLHFPFLGVHLTRLVDGSIHAGPNAVLAFSREGYTWTDVRVRELASALAYAGFRKLAWKYLGEGLHEMWRSLNKSSFLKTLQELVPELEMDDIAPAPAGVRAQALRPDGSLLEDFEFRRTDHALHVLNAPSPAATASLEIARSIVDQLPGNSF